MGDANSGNEGTIDEGCFLDAADLDPFSRASRLGVTTGSWSYLRRGWRSLEAGWIRRR